MSAAYEAIGRAVVAYIRLRYRRPLRVAAALALVAAVGAGAYLSARDVEEG